MNLKGVIAEATSLSGNLAATTDALHFQSEGQWISLPWHEIARATWNSESGSFVVIPVVGERLEWAITESGRLPEAARERITSTIITQDVVSVPGQGQVVIIFRKVGDQVVAQTIPALDSPLVRERIAQVRGELGIG